MSDPNAASATRSFLVVAVNEQEYAVESTAVSEVLLRPDVFYVPFCPEYVTGILNRHGTPHTVLDFSLMAGNAPTVGDSYLVFHLNDDQASLRVSAVRRIVTPPAEAILPVLSDSAGAEFFREALAMAAVDSAVDILVLQIPALLEKLRNDTVVR